VNKQAAPDLDSMREPSRERGPLSWLKLNGTVIHIPLWIFIAKEFELLFQLFGKPFASPSTSSNWFIANFIQWFGVLYGILIPLILVRAWEQLDQIDREFDKEADLVRTFYKDLIYFSSLSSAAKNTGDKILKSLHKYVDHVTKNYPYELKQLTEKNEDKRRLGDSFLENIREQFKDLIRPDSMKNKVHEFLTKELFDGLNEIISIRGDRISHASQRLFENLRIVALITSIIFLVPFYFAGLTPFVLDIVLIVSVTFLVIYLYMLVEDFDQPFEGDKRINEESWRNLLDEINKYRGKLATDD